MKAFTTLRTLQCNLCISQVAVGYTLKLHAYSCGILAGLAKVFDGLQCQS